MGRLFLRVNAKQLKFKADASADGPLAAEKLEFAEYSGTRADFCFQAGEAADF